MDHFFDRAARILASEMPRRQALRQLGGLFAGGLLMTLGVTRAEAGTCLPNTCPANKTCCPGIGATPAFCATSGKTCCGNTKCKSGDFCCPGNGIPFCRTKKQKCCGSTTCKSSEVCCGGTACCSVCTPTGRCAGSPS